MKRNKRSEVLAQEPLSPLTRRILEQMGPEGISIKERLEIFYRERSVENRREGADLLKKTH